MPVQPTAYSILELAIVSKGSSLGDTFASSLAVAQAAEAQGYTRFWLAEHHNSARVGSSSPPILIGHVAAGFLHQAGNFRLRHSPDKMQPGCACGEIVVRLR